MLWPCHIAGCNNSIRHIYASVVSFNIPTAQFFFITNYCGFRFASA